MGKGFLFSRVIAGALLMFILSGAGCSPGPRYVDSLELSPRADPAQSQWLERQSMLYTSTELLKVVSGSNLQWMAPVTDPAARDLFSHADTWLLISPYELVTQSGKRTFAQLNEAALWKILNARGIHGLYINPALVSGKLWNDPGAELTGEASDAVGFTFADLAGSEDDYLALRNTANKNGGILGLNIVPMATGLGPDFILAGRNMRQYPGLYALVEVPKDFWNILPPNLSEWQATPLTPAQVGDLAQAGLLPPRLLQDDLGGVTCGWAATGEVRGFDAQIRRFAYRYFGDPDRPVLNWTDPSSAARRVASASIIQTVGKWGAALTGTALSPLAGLVPGSGFSHYSLEPALTAATDIGQETRRYGGWSWQQDRLPLGMLRDFQGETTFDFTTDSLTSPGAEHALLTGDASYLKTSMARGLELGIDGSRLVHVLPGKDGVFYRPALRDQADAGVLPPIPDAATAFMVNGTLPLSGAGLSALALGITSATDLSRERIKEISQGHLTLAFFLAMQPGLLMLPAQDLAGTVTPAWDERMAAAQHEFASKNGVALLGGARDVEISSAGIVQNPALYAPLDEQNLDEDSFLFKLSEILTLRRELNVAGGKLSRLAKTEAPGVVALITALPDGSDLLTLVNFSRQAQSVPVALEKSYARVEEVKPGGGNVSFTTTSGTLTLKAEAWSYRAIRMSGAR